MENTNKTKTDSYLSFGLGDESFAVHTDKVLSILEMTNITPVPKAPESVKGVINLRGTVLPVIDTRIKFGMKPTEITTSTCIIVFEVSIDGEITRLGALVDSVQEVLELDGSNILPAPSIGSKYRSDVILGVSNVNEKFVMIICIDTLFSSQDWANNAA